MRKEGLFWSCMCVFAMLVTGCSGGSSPSGTPADSLFAFGATDVSFGLSNGKSYVYYVDRDSTGKVPYSLWQSSDGANYSEVNAPTTVTHGAVLGFELSTPSSATYYRVEADGVKSGRVASNGVRIDPTITLGTITGMSPNGTTQVADPGLSWTGSVSAASYAVVVVEGSSLSSGLKVMLTTPDTSVATEAISLTATPLAPTGSSNVEYMPSSLPLSSSNSFNWFILGLDNSAFAIEQGQATFDK